MIGVYLKALGGEPSTFDMSTPEGHYHINMLPLPDENGEIQHGLIIILETTALREAEARLQKQNAALTASKEWLERVVAAVVHDLRAPAVNMEGLIHELTSDAGDDPVVAHLSTSASRLRKTLDGLVRVLETHHDEGVEDAQLDIAASIAEAIAAVGIKRNADPLWVQTDVQADKVNFPELMLVDINLPGTDGFGFLQRFEELYADQYPNTRAWMVTSSIRRSDREKALSFRCCDAVIDKAELRTELEKRLKAPA